MGAVRLRRLYQGLNLFVFSSIRSRLWDRLQPGFLSTVYTPRLLTVRCDPEPDLVNSSIFLRILG